MSVKVFLGAIPAARFPPNLGHPTRQEFASFVQNAFFFERLWRVFDGIDENDDRRIDLAEV